MEPLKILQLADHSEIISGGAVQMQLLSRGLHERGHDVTCVFDRAPSPLEHTLDQVTAAGLRLVRVPMQKKQKSRQLRQLIATERFDVIHTHRSSYKVLLRSCTGMELPPVVVNRGQSRPIRDAELRKMHHPAVRAHVVVAAHIRELLVAAGIAAERIEVIYGSYDPERFHPDIDGSAVRREFLGRAPATTPIVGIVAKLSHYKSHDVFLEAAALLLRARGAGRFVIVGPDPDGARERLEALGRDIGRRHELPLLEHILFTGPRQDIPQVLAAFDVSVSASATPWEGLSGVMRESLAVGRPIVCTDVGGNREVVRDGETGRLVAPGDPQALAAAIGAVLADPNVARDLALAGHRLAIERFSNTARARRMEELYRRLLTEAHAAP